MTGRVYPSLRRAIHYTVRDFCARDSAKTLLLCEALNCKPSSLSAMTAEYEQESSRNPSPEDLETIMAVTRDDSIARTAADKAGSETRPKRDQIPDILRQIQETQATLGRQFQQLPLAIPVATAGKRSRP